MGHRNIKHCFPEEEKWRSSRLLADSIMTNLFFFFAPIYLYSSLELLQLRHLVIRMDIKPYLKKTRVADQKGSSRSFIHYVAEEINNHFFFFWKIN